MGGGIERVRPGRRVPPETSVPDRSDGSHSWADVSGNCEEGL